MLLKIFGINIWISSNKTFSLNICMGKHKEIIVNILSKQQIKSTNEILLELQNKTNKIINWHALYRNLMELEIDGKIEKLKSKAGFFWRKK